MTRFTLLLLTLLLFSHCKEKQAEETTTSEQVTTSEPQQAMSLPRDRLIRLANEADVVDIIYYDLPLSMNQADPASVKRTLSFIGQPIPLDTEGCKSLARVSFNANGEIIEEAELYLDNKCKMFVFLEGTKPTYAHLMTAQGINFLTQVLDNARQQ